MAQVICIYCQQRFNRDKESYIKIKNRYAHAKCALAKNPDLDENTIINPSMLVKCIYCKNTINKKDEDCVLVGKNRYAHAKCIEHERTREKTDEERLYDYIKEAQGTGYVLPYVRKQINDFITNYGYTYNGILRTIEYGVNIIHKMKFDNKNTTLGYVPYIYQEAQNYYYQLHLAEIKNTQSFERYTPKIRTINIISPKRIEHTFNPFKKLLEEGQE